MLGSLNTSLQYLTKEIRMQVIVNIDQTEGSVALPSNFNHMTVLWAAMVSDSARFHLAEAAPTPWTYTEWAREGGRLLGERYALMEPSPGDAARAANAAGVWVASCDQVYDLINTFHPGPSARPVDVAEAYAAAIPLARMIFGRMCRKFLDEEMNLI